jgi:hypothetical protein
MGKTIDRCAAILASGFLVFGAAQAASAAPVEFTVLLNGEQRVPSVADQSASTSSVKFTYDDATRVLTWHLDYSGVRSSVTAAQLRGPAVLGRNARVLVQLGIVAKNGVQVPSPVIGQATLTPRQAKYLAGGSVYVVVNTTDHPNGELRGQVIVPTS